MVKGKDVGGGGRKEEELYGCVLGSDERVLRGSS